jgi:trans-2,3-dihydro-3-hydroxyanthranilate isomerase
MASYEFVTVDVFTEQRFGGNPLAVFPDASGLSEADMQALAMELNLSETTFVLPPDNPQHSAKVRIFTPRAELQFAGHPNVGTAFVLARRMDAPPGHLTFEEGAGLVRVHLLRGAAGVVTGARMSAPRSLSMGIEVPVEAVAVCVGLSPDDIATNVHPPVVASVGMPIVVAEVSNVAALSRATPDDAGFRRVAVAHPEAGHVLIYLYVVLEGDARRLRARLFGPLAGVPEDPATGSAAATLAAMLTSFAPGEDVNLAYEIEQGAEMGRPSRLIATARRTAEGPILSTVAGSCVSVMRGVVDL